MKGRGLVPQPPAMLADLGVTSGMAYRYAQYHAARGVPVDIAAQHGKTVAGWRYCFWAGPAFWTALFSFVMLIPVGVTQIWWLSLLTITLMLYKRLNVFTYTPPSYGIHYSFSTGWLVAAYVLLVVMGFLAVPVFFLIITVAPTL